jgi:hypothetical protein
MEEARSPALLCQAKIRHERAPLFAEARDSFGMQLPIVDRPAFFADVLMRLARKLRFACTTAS